MGKLKRIGALLLLLAVIGLILLTLYLAVTGSRYFMASLVAALMLPCLLYVYLFIYRLIKNNGK